MGIPVYFSNIIQKYKGILKKIDNKIIFDVLFLDANSIIYDVYYSILKENPNITCNNIEKEIITKSIEKIINIINLFDINKEIIVCFDGVAPLSKLKQQRERRFKTWIKSKITEPSKWNTCNITPGTEFMSELNKNLKIFSNDYHKINKGKKHKITILDSNINGEGEQKIFEYLRNIYSNNNELSINMDKVNLKICIYGLDSDLIMLSLLHSNFYNSIQLYRETPEFIKNLDKKLDCNEKYLLNINNLSNSITSSLYYNSVTNLSVRELNFKTNINYIILFFLAGNDFIPHHPGLSLRLNGSETLINIYEDYLQNEDLFYIKNNKFFINWPGIKIVFKELSKIEIENIINYHDYKVNISNKILKNNRIMSKKEELLNNLPLFNTEIESFIVSNEQYISKRYYDSSFGIDYNIKDICFQYLKNIEWNFFYYIGQNDCCNYNYYYPYYHAPLFTDCLKLIPLKSETFYDKNINYDFKFIHPYTQLLYVLPSSYYHLLNKKIINSKKIKDNEKFKILFDDPNDLILDIDHNFVKYFFESVIHFKSINLIQLNNIIIDVMN